ncbi:hypothetical protein ACFY8W_25785 [Streptomyces sp. NPDC012637]|uniref:hypothetical protein n=1 Tax=Streptomyces sp. NPDC012637 TaxID=3364842 RepID=UPI0036F0D42E
MNGFTDIPNSQTGRGIAGGGLVVTGGGEIGSSASYGMQAGYVNGQEMGWGYLQFHSTGWHTYGDVWMDVTNDGGNSWIQCGPFTTLYNRITTAAYPTSSSPSRAFRVCGSLWPGNAGISCTGWW